MDGISTSVSPYIHFQASLTISHTGLGTFTQQTVTTSLVILHPFIHMEEPNSHYMDYHAILYWQFLLLQHLTNMYKIKSNNRHFKCKPTYMYVAGLYNSHRMFSVRYKPKPKKQMMTNIYLLRDKYREHDTSPFTRYVQVTHYLSSYKRSKKNTIYHHL